MPDLIRLDHVEFLGKDSVEAYFGCMTSGRGIRVAMKTYRCRAIDHSVTMEGKSPRGDDSAQIAFGNSNHIQKLFLRIMVVLSTSPPPQMLTGSPV